MPRYCTSNRPNAGFTIVELLIVVVVIAVLAAIVTVAYNGIQRQALTSMMKDTLAKVTRAIELKAVETNSYTTIPSTVQIPQGVGVALTVVADASVDYCLNVTTTKNDSLVFHQQKGGQPTEALCAGAVIESTIAGDYNMDSVAHTPETPLVELASAEGNFRLSTGLTWQDFAFSWDAVPGATRYEVQTRVDGGTWYYRHLVNGSGGATSTMHTYNSWNIPSTTLSLSWNAGDIKPSMTTAHEYRWRSLGATTSDWQIIKLAVRPEGELTHINNFTVQPSTGWTAMLLSWDGFVDDNNIPSPLVEVQTRDDEGTWYYRHLVDGSGGATNTTQSYNSWNVPADTTSLNWSSATVRPAGSSASHEYRIRIRSTVITSIATDWQSVKINSPSVADMSKISNFTVVPASDWSNVHLEWNMGSMAGLPNAYIEVQTRDNEGAWYYRNKTNGSGSITGPTNTAYSYNIPPTTTSLDWNSTAIRPSGMGIKHDYRIRLVTNVARPVITTDWIEVSLTGKTTAEIGTVQNFKVVPNEGWSSLQLSWNQPSSHLLASPLIELQTRVPGDTWYYRYISNGSGSSTAKLNAGFSWNIPITTTSLSWNNATSIPAPGISHEYRVRIFNTSIPAGASDWVTFTLTRP